MADPTDTWEQNAPGMFYVDRQCIACDACVNEAPKFFIMNNDDGHAYVSVQPQSNNEIKSCIEALLACPVDAIGQDKKE